MSITIPKQVARQAEADARRRQTAEHMMKTRHRGGRATSCALDLDPATRAARQQFRKAEAARWAALLAASRSTAA